VTRRNCPPAPSSILESMRGLGYTLSTALADLIDNSIAAAATTVAIRLHSEGTERWISLTDDGHGMDDATLEAAMRLGARDPREERGINDLGRFGLGLKTASFSQGRRLTVASKPSGGTVSCLRWDLDLLKSDHNYGWILLEGPAEGSANRLEQLTTMNSGTIVLIEKLDRLIGEQEQTDDLIRLLDELEAHLAMVFHRLLAPEGRGLRITINGKNVKGWDPFLLGHPGKALESLEYLLIGGSPVRAQLHVLPHRDLLTEREFTEAAGPGGWIQQQGIYVYRNKRLLVAGGWLRLGEGGRVWTRDEPHRLARIRLDIMNSEDAEWKIDVRKSTAIPPSRLRKQLIRLIGEARTKARRAFAGRGIPQRQDSRDQHKLSDPWSTVRNAAGTSYRIDRNHDLVASILDRAGPLKPELVALFRLLEETLPVQRIWIDTAEEKETPRTGFVDAGETEIMEILQVLFKSLIQYSHLTVQEARDRLMRTPPFGSYAKLVNTLGSDVQTPRPL
jgi:hypothetical protein